ncbi:MAG: hypothetical protein JWM32_621 [Verrucomicrobia bacterium]|nr:hypothetical protein [Verrucomicrobiota bacterium]
MPEAVAVVAVFFIAVVIYVAMWVKSRDPAFLDPRMEVIRLEHHSKWLEERLAVARGENWGVEMSAPISAELAATKDELARLK